MEMTCEEWETIQKAVKLIQDGTVKRIDVGENVMLYRVGNVVRIDIRTTDKDEKK